MKIGRGMLEVDLLSLSVDVARTYQNKLRNFPGYLYAILYVLVGCGTSVFKAFLSTLLSAS